jgi:hypothetical protein
MDVKKGYRTTEFWLTAIGSIGTLLNQSGILGTALPMDAILGVLGSIAAYAVSRGVAKRG